MSPFPLLGNAAAVREAYTSGTNASLESAREGGGVPSSFDKSTSQHRGTQADRRVRGWRRARPASFIE